MGDKPACGHCDKESIFTCRYCTTPTCVDHTYIGRHPNPELKAIVSLCPTCAGPQAPDEDLPS